MDVGWVQDVGGSCRCQTSWVVKPLTRLEDGLAG